MGIEGVDYDNLKPCPFCGGHAIMRFDNPALHWVQCEICHASLEYSPSQHHAAEEWNKRYIL